MTDPVARRAASRATMIGCGAIALWSSLAPLTVAAGPIPPFQMMAMTFGLGFAAACAKWAIEGRGIAGGLRWTPAVWALGVGGLFGYHAFYFAALALAPPIEANLINYAWPLLIVLFSGLLPGERFGWTHAAGAALGLAGCAILIGGGLGFDSRHALGYAAAAAAAVTWAGYSVISRRFGHVPTNAVGAFCGATAALAALGHAVFETTRLPEGGEWLAVIGLGLGPVGLAFYLWDHGVKHGHIKALGALAYLTPLLSTVALIVFGRAEASPRLWLAGALIVGGAAVASGDLWRRR